ncbi:MAG: putative DNA-binding domain-containing protein [Polyangiaceae bacterium]|nr:putative DNA-binding domain-containing protein [Polyangiaceae bacterium]
MLSDLVSVQTFLADALRHETPTPNDPVLAEASARFVTGNDRLSPAEQVDIYRQQFFLRHEAALREDYPGLGRILGKDATQRFFRDYLHAHPPTTPSLRDLGAHVPAFAAQYDAFAADRRALAVDMARYENALVNIFDGPDVPPLDGGKLAGLSENDWQTTRIVLHPLVMRLSLSYPVHLLRVDIVGGRDVTLPDAPCAVHVVLFRKDLITRYEELEPEAYALLGALGEGIPLVPALERVAFGLPAERQAYVASNLGSWFRTWTAWGIIVDIVPNG